jgi:Ca-activated chloride channel family protein
VETVKLEVTLQSQVAIKNIYSPTHALEVSRPTPNSARITSTSTQSIPTSDFRLLYDIGDQPLAASVLSYRPDSSDDGYFLLLVSPDVPATSEPSLPKTVLFVVDRSGSMSGKKIEQAKGALRFVLNNLREQDLFNIVAYDSAVESFRPELQRYTPETRTEALGYIESLYAGGSTNIHGALQTALAQLADGSRPTYVVFLTDGLPTAGERREPQIVAAAREANKVRARIFVLGVGYDVNSRLLDRLARECFGRSEYVTPEEDLETHVARLYSRIGAPALVDVKLTVDVEQLAPEQGAAISRVYPRDTVDLFAGDQLVLVGRYKQPGAAKVTIRGQANGQEQTFSFPAQLTDKSGDDSHAFIAKLWAIRRVGEIIDEIDLHGKNQELVNELVALATRHGILTPYTSFLADETANVRDLASAQALTDRALFGLSEEAGKFAFDQRLMKSQLQRENLVQLGGYAPGSGLAAGMGGAELAYPGMPGAAPATAAGAGLPAQRGATAGRVAGMPAGGGSGSAAGPGGAEVTNVLYVGPKTFFRRGPRWEDSELTEEQLRRVQQVERYSDAYFALLDRHGKDVAKYLALEGQVVVLLGDQAYEF